LPSGENWPHEELNGEGAKAAGKNLELVGLGSYIVNAQGDCNGCHSAGPPTKYTTNGNPYQLSPPFSGMKQINPATYLGGGRNFGALIPGSANIISRNLTPDKTGMPAGGRTFAQFMAIMRTGVDLDKLHPQCPSGTVTANCIPLRSTAPCYKSCHGRRIKTSAITSCARSMSI
jgi:hypothetical protein